MVVLNFEKNRKVRFKIFNVVVGAKKDISLIIVMNKNVTSAQNLSPSSLRLILMEKYMESGQRGT